jgi:hypothetical protein
VAASSASSSSFPARRSGQSPFPRQVAWNAGGFRFAQPYTLYASSKCCLLFFFTLGSVCPSWTSGSFDPSKEHGQVVYVSSTNVTHIQGLVKRPAHVSQPELFSTVFVCDPTPRQDLDEPHCMAQVEGVLNLDWAGERGSRGGEKKIIRRGECWTCT